VLCLFPYYAVSKGDLHIFILGEAIRDELILDLTRTDRGNHAWHNRNGSPYHTWANSINLPAKKEADSQWHLHHEIRKAGVSWAGILG
jgi:hypothetical protein